MREALPAAPVQRIVVPPQIVTRAASNLSLAGTRKRGEHRYGRALQPQERAARLGERQASRWFVFLFNRRSGTTVELTGRAQTSRPRKSRDARLAIRAPVQRFVRCVRRASD